MTPLEADILIVDDNPHNLQILVEVLKTEGYRVRVMPDGELALRSIRQKPPTLILLDIMMPGTDGYEVATRLKADPQTRDIPIIFLSALDDVTVKVKAFDCDAVDYIGKPFYKQEVRARVRTHLHLKAMQRQLSEQVEALQALHVQVNHYGQALEELASS